MLSDTFCFNIMIPFLRCFDFFCLLCAMYLSFVHLHFCIIYFQIWNIFLPSSLLPLVWLNGLNFLFLLWFLFPYFSKQCFALDVRTAFIFCDKVVLYNLNILCVFSTDFEISNLTTYSVNSVKTHTLTKKLNTKNSPENNNPKHPHDWLASYLIFGKDIQIKVSYICLCIHDIHLNSHIFIPVS